MVVLQLFMLCGYCAAESTSGDTGYFTTSIIPNEISAEEWFDKSETRALLTWLLALEFNLHLVNENKGEYVAENIIANTSFVCLEKKNSVIVVYVYDNENPISFSYDYRHCQVEYMRHTEASPSMTRRVLEVMYGDSFHENDSDIIAEVGLLIVEGIFGSHENNKNYSYHSTGSASALEKAKSYLRTSAFSYEGLIEQLEYSGFSNYEATYAANNCGADWNEQALRKAKSYLSTSAFSYKGLIDQLEYSGFTASQAKYGADRCGANWNEQAVKKAKSYLQSSSNWTKSRLKSQLEYSGFTSSEASYGVNHCGKSW